MCADEGHSGAGSGILAVACRSSNTWPCLSGLTTYRIALYHSDAVQAGRSRRNLYDLLRQPIDDARQGFRNQFFAGCPSMVDYLHLELTRTLANDDPDLFGSTYPGPLV